MRRLSVSRKDMHPARNGLLVPKTALNAFTKYTLGAPSWVKNE